MAEPGGGPALLLCDKRRPQDDGKPGTHDVRHVGHYVEIERPHHLLFSFSVPQYSSEETTVTLDILQLSSGGCELRLAHGLGSSDTARAYEARTAEGWKTVLQNMDEALSKT